MKGESVTAVDRYTLLRLF